MTTIHEVAKHACGLGAGRLRHIHGRTSEKGKATRQRVLESIRTLGCQLNHHERGLRSRRSLTVANLTIDPTSRYSGRSVSRGHPQRDALREKVCRLLVRTLRPDGPDESFGKLFRQRRFDAAVVHLAGRLVEQQAVFPTTLLPRGTT